MSVELPVLPLPETYTWGFVVARSIHAMGDTDYDEDRFPEARGSTGRVTFTPLVRFNKHTKTPTAFIHYEIVNARLENGELIDAEGHKGIYLISGVYAVSFMIDGGSIPSFNIEVLPEHTVDAPLDLVTAAPYVEPPGSTTFLLELPTGHVPGYVLAWDGEGLKWYDPHIVTPDPGIFMQETSTPGVYRQSYDAIEEFIIANRPVGDLTPAMMFSPTGSLSLGGSSFPSTLTLVLTADLELTLPTLPNTVSGTYTLVFEQDASGGHEVTIPGVFSSWSLPIEINPDAESTTMIHLFWTGYKWIALSGAYNIGAL